MLIAATWAEGADCADADCAALTESDWADGADFAADWVAADWAAPTESDWLDGADLAAACADAACAALADIACADGAADIFLDWTVSSAAKDDDAAMQATATRTAGVEYFSLAKFLDMFLSRDLITDAPGQ